MNWKIFLFSVVFAVTDVICASTGISPCRSDDEKCLEEQTRTLWRLIVPGIEELGIPSSDPMYLERIEGDLEGVKYFLTNNTMTGFADCTVDGAAISPDQKAIWKMRCPNLKISGQYLLDGSVLGVPVNGKGNYFVDTHDYFVTVTTESKRRKGNDGQFHLSYKNFKADAVLKGGFEYGAEDLFGDNKELADAVKRAVKESWQSVSKFAQKPIVYSSVEQMLKNLNTYLKTVPAEDIIKS